MSNVYGFSALTIAAEVAPGSDSGIFASTNHFRKQITVYPFTARAHSEKFEVEGRLHFQRPLSQPKDTQNLLSSRAWALQEDVLSPRVLRFAEQQIYWRCTESQLNEESPDCDDYDNFDKRWSSRQSYEETFRLANGADLNKLSKSGCLTLWYALVNDFTGRKISVYTDRLLAISAIAKRVATKIEQSYMAGVWAQDIHRGLLWSSDGPETYRPSDYIAPSWSWAALEFSCTPRDGDSVRSVYSADFFETHEQGWDAEIVEMHVQNINSDPFSQAQTGYIKVRGQCLEICRCRIPNHMYDCHTVDHVSAFDLVLESATNGTGSLRECAHKSSMGYSSLLLLQIGAWETSSGLVESFRGVFVHVLILSRINPAKDEYLRVGKIVIPLSHAFLSETWSTLSIVIL
jgi:hypothetical protein